MKSKLILCAREPKNQHESGRAADSLGFPRRLVSPRYFFSATLRTLRGRERGSGGAGDLRAILGANFRAEQEAAQAASGIANAERVLRSQIAMLDEKKTVAFYVILLGIVLILASVVSVTGTTLFYQCLAGGVILAIGAGLNVWYATKLKQLRA